MIFVFHLVLEAAVFSLFLAVALAFYLAQTRQRPSVRKIYDNPKGKDRDWYDVAVVGAGPAGATVGYYLAKAGWKVLLLERKAFPRDKYCGDAICKTGIEILMDMGVYQKLVDDNKALVADSGGLCSPGGLSFIGRSEKIIGEIPAAIACKRIHLDEAIARAAQQAGADLREKTPVNDVKFNKETGLWTITTEDSTDSFQCRVLVCADGAPSRLATKLGLVTRPPDGSCSRAYVEGGTHKFKADGVIFYHTHLLPGYAALFRHPNDEVNYCVYVIPGNPQVTNEDLAHWHDFLMKKDPNISKALGNNYKIERMKAGSLRLGGEPLTYSDHLLVVGDAAGMIDPMTGEGIHHAMEGGKIAAEFLGEAFEMGNFSKEVMKSYQDRWMTQFGHDYKWSMWMCWFCYRFPILIDATTAAVTRKGEKFFLQWSEIMTGRAPKVHLLRPKFITLLAFELCILLLKRLLGYVKKPKTQ